MKIIILTTIVKILAILIATGDETADSANQNDFNISLLKYISRVALEWLICFFLQDIGIDINIDIISVILDLLLLYISIKFKR